MKFSLTLLFVYAAVNLQADAKEEEAAIPLAPTGLTLVICDPSNKILDTIVIPEGKVSMDYIVTVPKDMVELRLFAIGGDRILERYRDNLTEMYCEARTDDKGWNDWGKLEATIKDGVLRGFNGAAGVKPLTITKEMAAQIRKDIEEDERSSFITVKGEQGGAERPAAAPKAKSEVRPR